MTAGHPGSAAPVASVSEHAGSARQRILETADRLFYGEGIHSVGIDRIIAESHVSKASFYKYFPSKDVLIEAYLDARHRTFVSAVDELGRMPSADALRGIADLIVSEVRRPGFRGCPFINAAAEYPDEGHLVRRRVTVHRDWFSETVSHLLRRAGHPLSGDAADDFVLGRDGAMSGGYSGDTIAAVASFQRLTDAILADLREVPGELAVGA